MKYSIVIPAYNEEANINKIVKEVSRVLKDVADKYEIIIVDDGSWDRTGEIADTLARENSFIKVIHHKHNKGYGAALWDGIHASRYDYIFFTDADLQFDLNDLKKLVYFVPEYEVVLGYRIKRRDGIIRAINAKAWNILNRIIFGLKVKDIDCAFKLFKSDVIKNVTLKSHGAMMSAELLINLQRRGVKFKEVPVTHFPRTHGTQTGAKINVILRAFKELMQLYRGELTDITQKQVIKFITVGIINTLVDFIFYIFLTRYFEFFGGHKVTTKIIAFSTGTITSFTLNRRWTLQLKNVIRLKEIVRFYLIIGSALMLNALSMYLFVHVFGFFDVVAAALANLTSFIWNVVLSKFWIFSSKVTKNY